MKARSYIIVLLVATSSLSIATAPLNEVVVTPNNESKFNFSVVLSGNNGPRSFVVYAPEHVKGDCVLGFSIAELKSGTGQLIYSQSIEIAPPKKVIEVRTEIVDPSHVLTLWLNYYCPSNHIFDGTRYIFSSADWEKSCRMQ